MAGIPNGRLYFPKSGCRNTIMRTTTNEPLVLMPFWKDGSYKGFASLRHLQEDTITFLPNFRCYAPLIGCIGNPAEQRIKIIRRHREVTDYFKSEYGIVKGRLF